MYRAKLQHDNGVIGLTIPAKNKKSAIKLIMATEGCPRNAIKDCKKIKI